MKDKLTGKGKLLIVEKLKKTWPIQRKKKRVIDKNQQELPL